MPEVPTADKKVKLHIVAVTVCCSSIKMLYFHIVSITEQIKCACITTSKPIQHHPGSDKATLDFIVGFV